MNNKTALFAAAIVLIALVGYFFVKSSSQSDSMTGDTTNTMMEQNMDSTSNEQMAEGVMVGGAMMTPDKDIVDNAVESSDHTTLVAAVQAAELVETLKGPGPFTVFAPTNAAFDKLPEGTVETLVMPENKEKLTSILTYHVVPGALQASDLTDGQTLTTVNGQTLTVKVADGVVMVNDAVITIPDVVSSNGVTHVVDTVLLPQE